MRLIEFEGTTAEFHLVKQHFNAPTVPSAGPISSERIEATQSELSDDEIREILVAALTRIPLGARMAKVFKALLKNPKGLTTVEFAKLLGITRAQLAGVFGAFGRRLSHTDKFPRDNDRAWLATNDWNGSERRYVLTQLGREALQDRRVGLVD